MFGGPKYLGALFQCTARTPSGTGLDKIMMDIIYLSPPNIKQTFDLHHVVYLTHVYFVLTDSILPFDIHLI
jgi:hypothetical protein